MKSNVLIVILLALVCLLLGFVNGYYYFDGDNRYSSLPLPEVIKDNEYGIDKNINENKIDKLMKRNDTVYIDVRLLEDKTGKDGEKVISGFVKGFEVIPYSLLLEQDGSSKGKALFKKNESEYQANYEESLKILEYYFPKNRYVFLMSGNGLYANMTKELLVSLGWSSNHIYNVGGYLNYNGKNKILVKKTINDKETYDFWKIPYHDIDFNKLTKIK
jgi:3-mercaptopyruvate sulfurtransferase SseA